ncbi:MAG: methytransferase partner Trm112 [Methanomicrobiaceae archaeon]|uniref:methytransferase partner Trm112 n=1 Tax=Methanoculleus sp. TaxID=90427 RepID=UPI00320CEB6C|nr:methytransferase partner Trm112 [Methanomicrobiaceae archaeon]
MRRDLVEILCCPVCKGTLLLTVTEENGGEVLEGTLRCSACSVDYPISEGIPNLLPQTVCED